MLDIPSISAVVAATGVIVGVILTIVKLRNLVKQRQTDLMHACIYTSRTLFVHLYTFLCAHRALECL